MSLSFIAPPEEVEAIAGLHSNPALLPPDEIEASVRYIGAVVLIITVLHFVLLVTFQSRLPKNTPPGDKSAWKGSYQLVNMLVNLYLGIAGIYYHYGVIPRSVPVTERIQGFESLRLFACIQIGYQLWAVPVGYFFVGEAKAMLFHHFQVIVVGVMSAFFWNGFRYVTPFFYGLIEISSVPLSVVNYFKSNPNLIKERPGEYTVIRVLFAVIFLTVRVFMWIPEMYDWLRNSSILCYTCDSFLCVIGVGSCLLAGFGLTVLQLIWASKIIEGLKKIFFGDGKKKSASVKNN